MRGFQRRDGLLSAQRFAELDAEVPSCLDLSARTPNLSRGGLYSIARELRLSMAAVPAQPSQRHHRFHRRRPSRSWTCTLRRLVARARLALLPIASQATNNAQTHRIMSLCVIGVRAGSLSWWAGGIFWSD